MTHRIKPIKEKEYEKYNDKTIPLKERIYLLIKERRHVSFVELNRIIPETQGEKSLRSKFCENIIIWDCLTDKAIDALIDLLHSEKIFCNPCGTRIANGNIDLIYMADGAHLNLPLVKRSYKYKKPHWLPVTMDIYKLEKPEPLYMTIEGKKESTCQKKE